jgi:hypothetical protein
LKKQNYLGNGFLCLLAVLASLLFTCPERAEALVPPLEIEVEPQENPTFDEAPALTIKWRGEVSWAFDYLEECVLGGRSVWGQAFLLYPQAPYDSKPRTYEIWAWDSGCLVVPVTLTVTPVNGMVSLDFVLYCAPTLEDKLVPILVLEGERIVGVIYVIVLARR